MKIKTLLALLLSLCMFLPVLAQTLPAPPPVPPQKPADDKQKPADDQDDVVKITTNLVQVDAVVTKDGKVVTNLNADDFEIYEDGKKQTITSFAYISNVPGIVAQPVVPKREKGVNVSVPPPPAVNRDQPHRTIAFVVDDLGTSAESMGQVRKQLRKFVAEQLQPNDLVAIIRTGGEMGALQQFTNDKRVLNRAVEQLRWNMCNRVGISVFTPVGAGPGIGLCGRNSMTGTLGALRFIIDAMGYLPGRKSLVLMSDHLPREDQDEYLYGDDYPGRRGLIDAGSSGGLTPAGAETGNDGPSPFPADSINYASALHKIAEKAIRASVVIYSVDTQGLQYTGPTAADQFRGNARQITDQINRLMSTRSTMLWARREGGELIARQTGGFQVRNSNGFRLPEIVEDQSGYYLLGYRPSDETFNRKFHHIKAKVKRSGMSLRTRFGFFGVTEDESAKTRLEARDLTNLALISPFAAQDINVDISSFFASDKSGSAVVRSFVYLDAKDMTFNVVDGKQQASFELYGVLFGDNGSIAEQLKRGATVNLAPEDYEVAMRNGMQFTFDIPVKKPGAYQVRVATRDRTSNRIGSASEFVAVPNLRDKRLAVSGVILGTNSDPSGQALANPGARRFTPNSDVHFAYIIYNAANETGALRNLVMQAKLFRDGKEVFAGPEVPVKALADQTDLSRLLTSGSVRLAQNLEPGAYYLQVSVMEVGLKDKDKMVPVVQWADFEVEK
ncbi:MAG TPA: VWA domain-containing protein [Pyrinomonadaceae bacterium]|nr:VWA domain-containing protein [Pyrinomonadaceae bacterium]